MSDIYLGLGSNLRWWTYSPAQIIERAVASLGSLGTDLQCSPFYRSPAWPDPSGPAYVNAVLYMRTELDPTEMLMALQTIEAGFGRTRSEDPSARYAPRTLDLDLLDHGGQVLSIINLELPHPRITERRFVLGPLCDLAPDWPHPATGETAKELLASVRDPIARLPYTGP